MNELPKPTKKTKAAQAGLNIIGGFFPPLGGFFSAASNAWSEKGQERANNFLKHYIEMLREEIEEKGMTLLEVIARLDMQDEKIEERLTGEEYQSILKKAFRDWPAAESEEKRKYVRNILATAASTDISSDDVVKLFLDWLKTYSEMHFKVVAIIYNNKGVTRGAIWNTLAKEVVREDSAEADLFKLMIRDLSMGGLIQQEVERNYDGNKIRQKSSGKGAKPPKSAFDDIEPYELTKLGMDFVHYAMNEITVKIEMPSEDLRR